MDQRVGQALKITDRLAVIVGGLRASQVDIYICYLILSPLEPYKVEPTINPSFLHGEMGP